jgi:nicotinate-nucleotide--dimethylbenzimidazole phosphoribosyltransferase
MHWLNDPINSPNQRYRFAAITRQQQLTKPAGSLGKLEELAIKLASLQAHGIPSVDNAWISIFAADHGIATSGVSAFPQSVTAEMVKNFTNGGAAINVLAKQNKAHLEIIDVGVASSLKSLDIIHNKVALGTANFLHQAAMNERQLSQALYSGKAAINRALHHKSNLFIAGEMGIANTSSATAIACHLLKLNAVKLTGAGTGLSGKQIQEKALIIQQALLTFSNIDATPLKALQYFGGFEIAALVGSYLAAAQNNLVILIDGFICTVAALVATKINPALKPWLIYSHQSQEQGHASILDELNAEPLLNLGMHLGEASGAVTALPLLNSACLLHQKMATFEQAQVAQI